MTTIIAYTNPTRIYRAYRELQHDLATYLQYADIYGTDTWARVGEVSDSMLFLPAPGEYVQTEAPVTLWYPPDVDVDLGYLIEVKHAMYYDGRLVAVETTLAADAAAGDTSLPVERAYGFHSGDVVLLSASNTIERCRVRFVDTRNHVLTLYSDTPLQSDWATGSSIRASDFYEVVALERAQIIRATCNRVHPKNE